MSQTLMKPIGYFNGGAESPYSAPRQGSLATQAKGTIIFEPHISRDCYLDLEGIERIWLIYQFHKNTNWKEKVRPPRFSEKKRSVLATRSPYRPSGLGLSCVRLDGIGDGELYISEHDLLSGTPIFDIKPYLPYADSFPDAATGWVKDDAPISVEFSEECKEQLAWLEPKVELSLGEILKEQLSYEPTNSKAKRVKEIADGFVFAIRTWRFFFSISQDGVWVHSLGSGYSDFQLEAKEDPYEDKWIHREFKSKWC